MHQLRFVCGLRRFRRKNARQPPWQNALLSSAVLKRWSQCRLTKSIVRSGICRLQRQHPYSGGTRSRRPSVSCAAPASRPNTRRSLPLHVKAPDLNNTYTIQRVDTREPCI